MSNAFRRCAVRATFIMPFAALLCHPFPGHASTLLGTAQSFTVLGYAGVTNTGATQVYGNVGVYPLALTAITGFPSPGTVTGGTIHGPDGVSAQAKADISAAAITLAGLAFTSDLTGENLGGQTLTPGVYFLSDATAILNGTLTLDAQSNPNALFVFQLASALTTSSGSAVTVTNGTAGTQVYWVSGGGVTLGSSTSFVGNILASSSVVLDSTASICGRAFAQTESVTLIDNNISNNCSAQAFGSLSSDSGSLGFSGGSAGGTLQAVPEPGNLSLLGMGLGAGFLFLRKFRSLR